MTEGVPEDLYTSLYSLVRRRLQQAVAQAAGEREDGGLEETALYRLAHVAASASVDAVADEVRDLEGGT
jgi:hypothetical protein